MYLPEIHSVYQPSVFILQYVEFAPGNGKYLEFPLSYMVSTHLAVLQNQVTGPWPDESTAENLILLSFRKDLSFVLKQTSAMPTSCLILSTILNFENPNSHTGDRPLHFCFGKF